MRAQLQNNVTVAGPCEGSNAFMNSQFITQLGQLSVTLKSRGNCSYGRFP